MVIYKIVNKVNGKTYIGQTTNPDPYQRVRAHFKKTRCKDLVYEARKKYGKDVFEWEVIYQAFDLEELNRAERYFIDLYKSRVPNGYNIQFGGDGRGRWDEESKRINGERVREWYRNNPHPVKGKKFSEEHIKNLSIARKGFDSPARAKAREKTHKNAMIKVVAIKLETKEEQIFESIAICAKELNLCAASVSRILAGKNNRYFHKGFTFRYFEKENNQVQPKPERRLKHISAVNRGGFSVKVGSQYVGWKKTLEEAIKIRDEYLKGKKNVDKAIKEDVE